METAVSTACLYPLETEKSLETLLALGFRRFELFANTECELRDAFIDALRGRLDAEGASVYSLHPFTSGFEHLLFFSDYPRRFEDGAAQYARYFRAARRLGASVVVFHGDFAAGRLNDAEYCERFRTLSGIAAGEGIILAQENVSRCRSRSVRFIRTMHQTLGADARFVLDLKQALRSEEQPLEMLEAMGDGIVNVHISDSRPGSDCLPPGCGDMNFTALLESLSRFGYDGPLVIEVYRNNFLEPEELGAAMRFVDSLVQKHSCI
ncbi:MAG: sugar phosphate isomerase/epimerase [Clostridia bacterium]|nr:sugar phosphate isomerase/epimerase [Clostridia bacterium]MDR3645011.1 sugar phosphate isomerase/epimerase [Clostridia bacterium]